MIFPLLMATFLVSCTKKETTNSETPEIVVGSVEEPKTDSTQAYIAATYSGEIPCADCEGIIENLSLKQDGTFVRESLYKNGKYEEPLKVEGKYKIEGQKVVLEGIKDGSSNLYELEGSDKLHYLTPEGKKVEGVLADKYILTKK